MSFLKKIIFSVIFALVILVIPGLVMLRIVDANNDFSTYIVVYGFILFTMFCYMLISVHTVSNQIENALEEMKMQNAAIAYKLINSKKSDEDDEALDDEIINSKTEKQEKGKKNKKNSSKNKADSKKQSSEKVNLNPADPLVVDNKKINDSYDDFK